MCIKLYFGVVVEKITLESNACFGETTRFIENAKCKFRTVFGETGNEMQKLPMQFGKLITNWRNYIRRKKWCSRSNQFLLDYDFGTVKRSALQKNVD